MCKESDTFYVKAIGAILVFILGGIATTFFVTVITPINTNQQFTRTIVHVKQQASPKDSLDFVEYSQRLDSIENVVNNIRDQYQMDISIGIDRLNGWVGFWLTILGMVLLLAGIWQYLQVKHHDKEWGCIKNENEKLKSDIDEKMERLSSREDSLEKNSEAFQEKLKVENEIFNVLRTMSAFHEPMMLLQEDERKKIMLLYLKRSRKLLQKYHELSSRGNEHGYKYPEDDSFVIGLFFANYRLNICRCRILFDKPFANIKIQPFLEYVAKLENAIRSGKSLTGNHMERFINKLCEIVNILEK